MIRIQLPQADVARLEHLFRSTDDRRLRDRLQIVLLAHNGRRHKDIAADLCINRRSVQRWLNAYGERGLDGLRPRQAPGQPGHIPAELVPGSGNGLPGTSRRDPLLGQGRPGQLWPRPRQLDLRGTG